MNLLRRGTILTLLAVLLCAPLVARAQYGPPPPVPPIADADRYQSYNLNSSTASVQVNFPVFGDCTDIVVQVNGVPLTLNSTFTCTSQSGGSDLDILPLPITDLVVTFTPPLTSGFLEIIGKWHPRDLVQPTAPGINRREFNQTTSTLIASEREVYRALNNLPVGQGSITPAAPGALAQYGGNNPSAMLEPLQPQIAGGVQQLGPNGLNAFSQWYAPATACAIPSTARTVLMPAGGPLSCTLPPAASFMPGVTLEIDDYLGNAGISPITLVASGTDSINGNSSVVALSSPFATQSYESDGISRWFSSGGSVLSAQSQIQDFCLSSIPGCTYNFAAGAQSITLANAPLSAPTLSIYFDGVNQAGDTWSLTGEVVTFNAPIPSYVQVVEAKWSSAPSGNGNVSIANTTAIVGNL